jgi:hypothetical protein
LIVNHLRRFCVSSLLSFTPGATPGTLEAEMAGASLPPQPWPQ